jgi:dynein heavy chain
VYLGGYNLKNRGEQNTQQIDVLHIFVHEEFDSSILKNDIAMLLLSSSVKITAEVRPVCLWNAGDTSLQNIIDKNGVVVGWGRYEFGKISDKLRMVRMPVVPKDICLESDEKFYPIFTHKTSFCAGNRNGNSVCNGDSGGGLMFSEKQRGNIVIWKLRGIVSTSKPDDNDNTLCNAKNYIIFTDIAHYLDWIRIRLI